jgi:Peptidase A4 family
MYKSLRIIRVFGSAAVMAAVLATTGLPHIASGPAALPKGTRMLPRRHGPVKMHGRRPDNQYESENWAGYAVTGSSFTETSGSWNVPVANCSVTPGTGSGRRSQPTYSSFWVGIDGDTDNTVEQIGTDSDCDGTTPTYYAWFEFYPNPSYEILGFTVSPGNTISATVSYNGSGFTVTIRNLSTGQSYSTTGTVRRAQQSSAEWIAEAPCCTNSGGILPLADFGTVNFGIDYTGAPNTDEATDTALPLAPISDFGTGIQQINMESSSGVPEATTSGLSPDGTSFTVTWNSE